MLGLMMNDIALHSSLYLDSKLMKKLLVLFLLLGTLLPSAEAGVSPEGIPRGSRNFFPEGIPRGSRNFFPEGRNRPRKPRCKSNGKVTVCRMPKPRKCTVRRPCIPRDYYRPHPRIPMPLR